ncbi:unnamed protein product [Durusdinium trenchii]|uniref:Metacaspase-1 n=2 Tax=Durusdinium trenchii TaxID=1381693 RepID=A0ABP0JD20_9DINO
MDLLRCLGPICCGDKSPRVSAPQRPQRAPVASLSAASVGSPRVPLTGRKRSLLVGINYFGSSNELHGCVADVQRMCSLLDLMGFPQDQAQRRVLVDTPQWPGHLRPTLKNMREGIAWLTADAEPGDCLLLHYSGHGGRMPREGSGSEWHETLCPVDMDTEGMLLDTELFETLVRPLPAGCRLTCILDSCHSGGVLDLPFIFVGTQENLASALAGEAAQMVMARNWLDDWRSWQDSDDPTMLLSDVTSMGMDLWGLYSRFRENQQAGEGGFRTDEAENQGAAVAEVIAFTGCASEQTSADVGDVQQQFHLQAVEGGHLLLDNTARAGGALTSAFIEAMQSLLEGSTMTYVELLEHLRQRLANEGFSQVPQLASSLILDLQEPFSLDTVLVQSSSSHARARHAAVGPKRSVDAPASYPMDTQGGFATALMGAANAFFTAEAVEEGIDLLDEAGDMLFENAEEQDDF